MNLVVVIPTRGRPDGARLTVEAIRATSVRVSTQTILAVDADDPELDAYRAMVAGLPAVPYADPPTLIVLEADETGDLVRATNTVALRVAREDPGCVIGNLGDDHRPRTLGWDRVVLQSLQTPGIAYGDDLLQGRQLPTAPFISASIVLALGWYALPVCRHMFIDDAWRELGDRLEVLRYLPDVVIEHVHPGAGKADTDAGYLRADASTEHDREAFESWRRELADRDVDAVRDALRAVAV